MKQLRSLLVDVRAGFAVRTGLIAADERELAGVGGGLLWLCAATAFALLEIAPDTLAHRIVLAAVVVLGYVGGIVCVTAIRWQDAPNWLFIGRDVVAQLCVVVAGWATGGMETPAPWIMLFTVLYASNLYTPRFAIGYVAFAMVLQLAPLIYDSAGIDSHNLLALVFRLLIASGMCATGVSVRALMWLHRHRAERAAAHEAAMRAITTAVIDDASIEAMHTSAARELSRQSGDAAVVTLRIERPGEATVMGTWPSDASGQEVHGSILAIDPQGAVGEALRHQLPVRTQELIAPNIARRYGYSQALIAPVRVGSGPDGVIVVMAAPERSFDTADEERLMAFAEMLALAIRSRLDRARLLEQASSDALTGLANRRVFHTELAAQVDAAGQQRQPLAVAVIDIDEFKQVNDSRGHAHGDQALIELAAALRSAAATTDLLSRTGGDEFCWLMPGLTAAQAHERVNRARQRLDGLTFSAGVSDVRAATDPQELLRCADSALYLAKSNGRDCTEIYDAATVEPVDALHDPGR